MKKLLHSIKYFFDANLTQLVQSKTGKGLLALLRAVANRAILLAVLIVLVETGLLPVEIVDTILPTLSVS